VLAQGVPGDVMRAGAGHQFLGHVVGGDHELADFLSIRYKIEIYDTFRQMCD
jgi:hypothetical protein